MRGRKLLLLFAVLLAMAIAGCGSESAVQQNGGQDSSKTESVKQDNSPVSLMLYVYNALTDDEFNNFFVNPTKKKYPNITLSMVKKAGQGTNPEDMVTAGTPPDIILVANTSVADFQKLDLVEDAEGYIKKYNVDLNQFDPAALNALRALDSQGKLLGLPYAMNFAVLYYNKDIFDKFGVSYPKDGMSWNQTVELARKVTRSDGGVNYVGLDPTGLDRVGSGLSLPYVDPKTNKPLIDTDGWKKSLNMLQGLYDTPGFVNGSKYSYGSDAFTKDKTLAMLAEWGNKMSGLIEQVYTSGDKMNWDMAALPNFEGSVGTGRETDLHALLVSKVSKHKDQAFQVTALVGSDEVQQITNSYGRLTALKKTDAYKKSFGTKLTSMNGKHIDAIFTVTPGPTHVPTIYDKSVTAALKNADKAVALKQKDVNTALRDAQAEADKAIQAQLNGGK